MQQSNMRVEKYCDQTCFFIHLPDHAHASWSNCHRPHEISHCFACDRVGNKLVHQYCRYPNGNCWSLNATKLQTLANLVSHCSVLDTLNAPSCRLGKLKLTQLLVLSKRVACAPIHCQWESVVGCHNMPFDRIYPLLPIEKACLYICWMGCPYNRVEWDERQQSELRVELGSTTWIFVQLGIESSFHRQVCWTAFHTSALHR